MSRVFWDTNLFIYLMEGSGERARTVGLFITNDERLSQKVIPGIHFITSLDRTLL